MKEGENHVPSVDHCRVGFFRRRRHPGRPEDFCRPWLLRHERDHRCDGPEHHRSDGHPEHRSGGGGSPDRCGVPGYPGGRGQGGDGVQFRPDPCHRQKNAAVCTPCSGGGSGDGGHLRQLSPGKRSPEGSPGKAAAPGHPDHPQHAGRGSPVGPFHPQPGRHGEGSGGDLPEGCPGRTPEGGTPGGNR